MSGQCLKYSWLGAKALSCISGRVHLGLPAARELHCWRFLQPFFNDVSTNRDHSFLKVGEHYLQLLFFFPHTCYSVKVNFILTFLVKGLSFQWVKNSASNICLQVGTSYCSHLLVHLVLTTMPERCVDFCVEIHAI